MLTVAGEGSASGVLPADTGAEETGLLADCVDGGRVLVDAVNSDGMLEACGVSVDELSEGMAGLPPVAEADWEDGSAASGAPGIPTILVDITEATGVVAGTAGLEPAVLFCTAMPAFCGLGIESGVAGGGRSEEDSV